MDYKKIFKSRVLREKILSCLCFVPDKFMIKIQYKIKTGRKLNLKTPKRYTEKLQWYKLYYKDKKMVQCVDKYDVREYLEKRGYGNVLSKCLGVYENEKQINFDTLPNSFVLKDTLGGGGNSVLVVKDKNKENLDELRKKIKVWRKRKLIRNGGREWPYYKGKKHRIFCEELLECEDGDLPDYKFYCFNGECKAFYKRVGYTKSHEDGEMCFYSANCEKINVSLDYCQSSQEKFELPENINEMIRIAENISSDFPHCRIDLYNVKGKIIFGEMTFFSASGYFKFMPDEFDEELGENFCLPNVVKA